MDYLPHLSIPQNGISIQYNTIQSNQFKMPSRNTYVHTVNVAHCIYDTKVKHIDMVNYMDIFHVNKSI